jgi:hypothetical protein
MIFQLEKLHKIYGKYHVDRDFTLVFNLCIRSCDKDGPESGIVCSLLSSCIIRSQD